MQINFMSADLKLVHADDPETRSFRILEFNDGLRSGFSGYDALSPRRMVSDRVVEDYKALFPSMHVTSLAHQEDAQPTGRLLMVPRSDRNITHQSRMDIVLAHRLSGHYDALNKDVHIRALCENKAYQLYMAEQAGMQTLFPRTQILSTDKKEALQDLQHNAESYVLKPLTMSGGNGIRLIEDSRLERDMSRYLTYKRFSREDYWPGLYDEACVLQERVPPNPVEARDGLYDGTMRVAFTVYSGKEGLECHIHDAYWKLPECRMGTGTAEENVVSFSPSNMEKKHDDDIFRALFSFRSGSSIKSQLVEDETKSWLFPQLKGELARYFGHIETTSHIDMASALVNEQSAGMQALGYMIATDTLWYPAARGQAPDMHYPREMVDVLLASKMVQDGEGKAFDSLKTLVSKYNSEAIRCEDMEEEFSRPLRAVTGRKSTDVFDFYVNMISTLRAP